MWDAIGLVSTSITLIAFLGSIVAIVLRSLIARQQRLIKAASESNRPDVIAAALQMFAIDTTSLTKAQKYQLATDQLRARSVRFTQIILLSLLGTIIFSALSCYAVYLSAIERSEAREAISKIQQQNEVMQRRLREVTATAELIQNICDHVSPTEWLSNGGSATISAQGSGIVAVTANRDAHEQLGVFLNGIRKSYGLQEKTFCLTSDTDRMQFTNQVLCKPVSISFRDVPLKDVAEFFTDFLGVDVKLNLFSLDLAGVEPDEPVTLEGEDIEAKAALRMILHELELHCVVRDWGCEVISLVEYEDEKLQGTHYVGDIVSAIIQGNDLSTRSKDSDSVE